MHPQRGFTLIEALLSIALIGFLAAAAIVPIGEGARAYQKTQELLQVQEMGRSAVWRMERELRELRQGNIVSANASSLTFVDTYQETIAYSLVANQILRNTVSLADHVSALVFTYYDKNNAVLSSWPLSASDRNAVYMISFDFTINLNGTDYYFRDQIFPRELKN